MGVPSSEAVVGGGLRRIFQQYLISWCEAGSGPYVICWLWQDPVCVFPQPGS